MPPIALVRANVISACKRGRERDRRGVKVVKIRSGCREEECR